MYHYLMNFGSFSYGIGHVTSHFGTFLLHIEVQKLNRDMLINAYSKQIKSNIKTFKQAYEILVLIALSSKDDSPFFRAFAARIHYFDQSLYLHPYLKYACR